MKSYTGLSNKEVIEKRKKYGTNSLSTLKRKTFLSIFIESLGDPIIKILLIALGIKLLFIFSKYDWYETIGIAIAAMLASFISTISEYGSEQSFKRLQEENNNILVKVYRNNNLQEISINEIVKEDIIKLSLGDIIPADGILIDGYINTNESTLTGEVTDIKKNINSKLFRGTTITYGSGIMKVISVGNNTEYGKIYNEILEKNPTSPLKKRLYELAKIISKIGYIGAIIVSLSYLFNKIVVENNFDMNLIMITITTPKVIINYLIYALSLAVTIIIVAVPEGLPMMITLVLSSNMKKMMKDNVLVRNPVGIETSGNIEYLLIDKTGTLTKGMLDTIAYVTPYNKKYNNKEELKNNKYYEDIYKSIIINNESIISNNNIIGGNATDRSLIKFLDNNHKTYHTSSLDPFDSIKKYSSIKIDNMYYFKGAEDKILSKCVKYIDNNYEEKYIINHKTFLNAIKEYTNKGYRIITLAKGRSKNNLTYLGFMILKDELRSETYEGISIIKDANINVIMITGDDSDTAKNIAIDCGIITSSKDMVLTSDELNKMDSDEIYNNIHNIKVIARALPQDKSRLANILVNNNIVVGMGGDGVNDAPALRKANVGFAMGSGCEVAKEASDIIILDNNILSISKAILYGRCIFKSIRRFVMYQLTVNFTALFLSIIGTYIGISTPITIIQMLWLNMIMDTFAAIAFSFEPPYKYYMDKKPKKLNEPIINRYMYSEIIITSIYSAIICILFLKLPIIKEFIRSDYKYFMTAYFALFIFIGIFNAFNSRSERLNIFSNIFKNKMFMFIFMMITLTQIFIIYYGSDLFRTYGLYLNELIFVIILASTVLPVEFIRKIILKKKGLEIEI